MNKIDSADDFKFKNRNNFIKEVLQIRCENVVLEDCLEKAKEAENVLSNEI